MLLLNREKPVSGGTAPTDLMICQVAGPNPITSRQFPQSSCDARSGSMRTEASKQEEYNDNGLEQKIQMRSLQKKMPAR